MAGTDDDGIVVERYDEYERAASWYCYLQDGIQFPFTAKRLLRELFHHYASMMKLRSLIWLLKKNGIVRYSFLFDG